jgi:hypothetical protein
MTIDTSGKLFVGTVYALFLANRRRAILSLPGGLLFWQYQGIGYRVKMA